MEATGKQLEQPSEVMRRAYGTKLKSLRRSELNRLFQIHKITHPDMIKDDLVKFGEGIEAMGYDLWKRPEEQTPPKSPFQAFAPTPSNNVEGSGEGRTTSETLQQPVPEPPAAVPMEDRPVESDIPKDDPARDEWPMLKKMKTPQIKKLVKAMGLKQHPTNRRNDLTTNVMAHCSTTEVEKWIAENVEDKDAS